MGIKHIATLSARYITPLTNILKYADCSAASKVEESVAMFFSCHCAIANCDHLIDML